jgi:hypothetical protein
MPTRLLRNLACLPDKYVIRVQQEIIHRNCKPGLRTRYFESVVSVPYCCNTLNPLSPSKRFKSVVSKHNTSNPESPFGSVVYEHDRRVPTIESVVSKHNTLNPESPFGSLVSQHDRCLPTLESVICRLRTRPSSPNN